MSAVPSESWTMTVVTPRAQNDLGHPSGGSQEMKILSNAQGQRVEGRRSEVRVSSQKKLESRQSWEQ